jgi:1,4-alpha-glucan branching enzyme
MASIISKTELSSFLTARNACPHDLLGMHKCTYRRKKGLVVRAFIQNAKTCEVINLDADSSESYPMDRLTPEGFYEVFIGEQSKPFAYQLRIETYSREVRQFFDPYVFKPTLGDQDLYLFNEGNEHRVYTKLGAHLRVIDGVPGVSFAVWAPNAKRVSVVGNFNHWDGRYHRLKTDPYGSFFEPPPNNASVVYDNDHYEWGDTEWVTRRAENTELDRAISIYEVHFASWRRVIEDNDRPLGYRELAPILADYVIEMGFTHVELMPVAEHPFSGSWGYQVTGFFAPTHRFGEPDDFKYFVDHMHRRGIGIILDWVPAHFPRDQFALAEFDGTHLYEHEDPRQGAHQDWGTLIFNYTRNEVRGFLIANALSWLERYHIDGLRVDAVASMLYLDYSREEGEWVPNQYGGRENIEAIEFLRQVNDLVHEYYPGALMIAEESTSFGGVSQSTHSGGLGFDFKWNMGWMHDTLCYFSKDPLYRKWHQNDLTFGMLYQYAENFISVFSHDEVTHGKASMLFKMGAWNIPEKSRNLRALYAHMWAYPGKKLLFMGSEFGQASEWKHDASLDWHLLEYIDHEGIRRLVKDLNHIYRTETALHANDLNPASFRWINCTDTDSSLISFLRMDPVTSDCLAVVGHYTPVTRTGYRIGLPHGGFWKEVINTDSEYYGGTNEGNIGGIQADQIPNDGLPYSAVITLPPLSTCIFKWVRE